MSTGRAWQQNSQKLWCAWLATANYKKTDSRNVQVQCLLLLILFMGRLFHIFYHENKILYFLTRSQKCQNCLKNWLQQMLGNRIQFVSNQKTPFWKLSGLCSVGGNTQSKNMLLSCF